MNRLYTASTRYSWRQKLPFPQISCKKLHFFNNHHYHNYTIQLSHASLLHKLRETKPLQQIHTQVIVSNLSHNLFLCNRLVNAYASCGLITQAQIIFSQIHYKNLVSWTILVSGLTRNGHFLEAIEAFYEMVVQEIKPNEITIASVLPAFGNLGDPLLGKSLHCYWIRQNLEDNVFVETGFVDMYAKFGCLSVARYLFDEMSMRNVVSWNVIISGYFENGYGEEALWMFNRMRRKGFSGDILTMVSLVSGCLSLEDLRLGSGIHGLITRSGFENDQLVKTSLMELYINADFVNDAYCIFCEINRKDLVSWTLMLRGFSRSGNWRKTIEHFSKMIEEDEIMLDSVCFTTILSACSSSGSLEQGKRVHGLVIKAGFQVDIFVGSSLIDMYANCANIKDAMKCFESMEEKDVACWNALISGYGMMGNGNKAINLFLRMKHSGLYPNESTFVSVLYACSHAGLVNQGLQIFGQMIEIWNIVPSSKHYACVIDLLARAGRLKDAYSLMKNMNTQPGIEVYGSLLTACRIYKNFDMGFEISKKLFQLRTIDAGYYVLLSNVYALAGNWAGVKNTRSFLKSKNLRKEPGFSSVEINGEIFTFMASQTDHIYYPEIKEFLIGLFVRIEAIGYEPDMNSVYHDVTDDVKKDILFHHSEKLAIAFGLMETKPGTNVIRVTKNLRICNDCHSACKFISQVYAQVLVIKDSNRFHVFQDGVCSCKDYW